MLIPVIATLNTSVEAWIMALIVLIIGVILFSAAWPLLKPFLGAFANLVLAFIVIILILVIAHFILGVF